MKIYLLAFLPVLIGCSNSGSQSQATLDRPIAGADSLESPAPADNVEESGTARKDAAPPPLSFPTTFSAGKVTFNIETPAVGAGPAVVRIEGSQPDFSKEFEVGGEVRDAFLLDLDKDGFSELYVVFAAPGAAGQLALAGYASYRDRSAGEIYVKEPAAQKQPGSDQVFTKGEKLFRTFTPANGGAVKWAYSLKKGETSFVLTPSVSK